MYTKYTYQDWESTPEASRTDMIEKVIDNYKASYDFIRALEANAYFSGNNTNVNKKRILAADVVTKSDNNGRTRKVPSHKEIVGNRIGNGFFFHFITQQNQYLLSNGVIVDEGKKDSLGNDIDHVLAQIGENALLHGVGWGFWNNDHLECISAAKDIYSGFVALLDEVTGIPRLGVEFWQLDSNRPLCVRLFEQDGVTILRKGKDGKLFVYDEKRAYVQTVQTDITGSDVVCESNYGILPVIPLYANDMHHSELTNGLKAKIDAYDNIVSDLADNLDRANDVYWVLNNYGGSTDDVLGMIEQINKIRAVVSMNDGMGGSSSAEPRTIEVPYQARQTALDLLKKAMYSDYMALDTDELSGGSLTNVAIKVAMTNINLKADRYEWQVRRFVRGVMRIAGVESESIYFKRSTIANDAETIASIYQMRTDIDHHTALKLNPLIDDDDIDTIIQNVMAEGQTGMPSVQELQKLLDEQGDDA